MHQTKVRKTITKTDVQPGEHDDGDHLENDKYDGEEAVDCMENIHTVGIEVNDKVCCELQKMIHEGSNPKYKGSLA